MNTQYLHPQFITGFSDAEGSFIIFIHKDSRFNAGWQIRLGFSIGLHLKENIKMSLGGIGSITKQRSDSVLYKVLSLKQLEVVINHFDSNPLITQKWSDYQLFKQAFDLITRKEHLTQVGLEKIVAIKASINKGLSDELKAAFPDVIPTPRPLSILKSDFKDPNWLAGFVSGEGNFYIHITGSKTHTIGISVALKFAVTQHFRDIQLIESFTKIFKCGRTELSSNNLAGFFVVTKFSDIYHIIIPYFKKNPILGVKSLDFADFCEAAELVKGKGHLTEVELEKIKKIKAGMNSSISFSINQNLISSKIDFKKPLGKRFLSTTRTMHNSALNSQRVLTICFLNSTGFSVVKCSNSICKIEHSDTNKVNKIFSFIANQYRLRNANTFALILFNP